MREQESKFTSKQGALKEAETPKQSTTAESATTESAGRERSTASVFKSSGINVGSNTGGGGFATSSHRKDPAQELADTSQMSSEFNEYLEYFLELQKIRASKKVLIVEDDPISLLGLRHIVKNFNPDIKCFLAINIDEALDILEKEKCDLLISDYYLSPTETGLELWDLVRQQHPEVDVVITSGIGMEKYRQIVQNCDFPPPFFDKPFSAEKFNGYLKEIFGSTANGKS